MFKNEFTKFSHPMQMRYEAIRSYYIDNLTPLQIADKFKYSINTVYKLLECLKNMNLNEIFYELKTGPKTHHTRTLEIKDTIINLRKKNYSIPEIKDKLYKDKQTDISFDTIQRILKAEGFTKLFRRTKPEILAIQEQDKIYPDKTGIKLFQKMKGTYQTAYAGIFLFLPVIKEIGLDKLFSATKFYGTETIPTVNYLLSYLTLKLIGCERLSHITDLSFDEGLGIFNGLNALPKSTALTQYSYRHPSKYTIGLLKKFVKELWDKKIISGNYINLDFHYIPYYGVEESLDKNWIPTRNKKMKSIVSFFAQDMESNYLLFSDGEIDKDEVSEEIIKFIEHFKSTTGIYPKNLIFDSKLTTYDKLNDLDQYNIKFITLRKRGKRILNEIDKITDWTSIVLNIPKRIYTNIKVKSRMIKVNNYEKKLREITVTGNGRNLPMVIITNELDLSEKEIITIYAKRWRIENNIQENVDFFNLNAINSPVIVNMNFDIAMTLIANSLYKYLASKIKPLSKCKPKKIFRSLIENKGTISIDDNKITVHLGLKSFNPYIANFVNETDFSGVSWIPDKIFYFKF